MGQGTPEGDYLDANRTLWDTWARLHHGSPNAVYDLDAFRAGRSTLSSVDRQELGGVAGKSVLHLQCHFGMDTLSLARLGAEVTGVDFSPEAIRLARRLSDEIGVSARFVESSVDDLPDRLQGRFDRVYTSHGVLFWLPDLARWGRVIAHFLKPGGEFLVVDGHPFASVLEADGPRLDVRYPYFMGPEPLRFETHGTYADRDADVRAVEYGWNHSFSQVTGALLDAGLQLTALKEYPFSSWQMFPFMERDEDGWWHLPQGYPGLPLMFSLKARQPGSA